MRIVLAAEKENGSAFPLRYISLMSGYSVAIKHTTRGSEPYMKKLRACMLSVA